MAQSNPDRFAPSTAGGEPLLMLRNVSRRFGETKAVRPLDLDISPLATSSLFSGTCFPVSASAAGSSCRAEQGSLLRDRTPK